MFYPSTAVILKIGQTENVYVSIYFCNLFSQLIIGKQPRMTNFSNGTEQDNYFKIKFLINNNDNCFVF